MEIRLKQHWYNIKSSLWFLPSVMGLSAVVLALALVKLDKSITYEDFPIGWFIYGGQRDGARAVLSTIASSMVTISGVTFSITLVALTMASSQFGPRLLRNFIADKGNQFVIGTLIATFIYSLIILLTIRGSGEDEFIPKISVVFAFFLAVFSLGVIIYFIHHITTSIQADFIIKSTYNEFRKAANEILISEAETVAHHPYEDQLAILKKEYVLTTTVNFHISGFIQSIHYNKSCKWAKANNAVVEWLVHPGSFATVHNAFVVVHHKTSLEEGATSQLRDCMVIAYQRTPNQDLLFSLKQIVEVGVRALSPGTNDPHTAITCIQWLGAALSELANKSIDVPFLADENAVVRVLRRQINFQMIVDTCFDHLRLYAKANKYVMAEMLYAIEKPLRHTNNKEFKEALKEKAGLIYKETMLDSGSDLLPALNTYYQKIMQL